MEYGKLDDISLVNWTFPDEDPGNAKRLHSSSQQKMSIHLGSPAWGAKYWIDKIYPKQTPVDKYLHYYSRAFNCIELNRSHYGIPDEKMTEEWLEQVPNDFLFCPKIFKEISHTQFGLYDKKLQAQWIYFIQRLGKNLGPCFIQFHENFSYERKSDLFHFIENWPSEFELSVELRHPSWFKNHTVLPALADYLSKKKIGLVITDVAGKRDVLHTTLSSSWAMIRLIGNNLDSSDELRLHDWAKKIKTWEQNGLKKVYLFLHQPDDIWTIEFSILAHKIFSSYGFNEFPKVEKIVSRDLFNF